MSILKEIGVDTHCRRLMLPVLFSVDFTIVTFLSLIVVLNWKATVVSHCEGAKRIAVIKIAIM